MISFAAVSLVPAVNIHANEICSVENNVLKYNGVHLSTCIFSLLNTYFENIKIGL
jgi:hypothetical protein